MDGTELERANEVIAHIRLLVATAGQLIAESRLLIMESQRLIDAHHLMSVVTASVPVVVFGPTLANA